MIVYTFNAPNKSVAEEYRQNIRAVFTLFIRSIDFPDVVKTENRPDERLVP